ncbi:MAG: HlyD family efflux transporter periplasmic adaptor subunit [Candidatus Peribacteraceae bacterium]|nr:HlyD family efflux transporter periplasmic adaptor subunit [Candidatus Peribacteraceae bacterium]MDD5075091.1 HlyD family efflux transporter periplasmic adaptor subunit [Candidatus Peribacteraceae bacterium]
MFISLIQSIKRWAISLKSFIFRHPIALTVAAVLLVPVVLLLVFIFKPVQPQYITAAVRRGDLVQKVEAVGTVTSDRALTLKFPVTGIVEEIRVKEGDKVVAGQELANLRNSSYVADIASAAAQYRSARATLQELEDGTRPEDIAIAEADVANKRASLDAAKEDLASAEEKLKTAKDKLEAIRSQADTNLAGSVSTAGSSCSQQLALAKTALRTLDDIFIDSTVTYLAEQYDTTAYSIYRLQRSQAAAGLDRVSGMTSTNFSTYTDALGTLREARTAIMQTTAAMQQAYDILSVLPLTTAYSSTVRETYKGTIATQKASAQTALSSLDTTLKSLQDASANYDTSIATEENNFAAATAAKQTAESDILTFETTLRSAEAQLALKKAGPRETSIDVARANANAAAAAVSRAQARLEDTIIRAPADGTVTKVDFKLGEFTGDADNIGHSITMLGTSPFRVEMFLSEVDIPKVILTQTGSIELDAFPSIHYALRVSGVEPGPTKIEGVSKYRVNLNFVHPHEEFKIGMTGDAEIITGERKDVLLAPSRAIIQSSGSGATIRVLEGKNVVEKSVTIGMEGDTDTAIESGLTEGETVIVLIKK